LRIEFSLLDVEFDFYNEQEIKELILFIILREDKSLGDINFIFTTNEKILEINQRFLGHNYFTDVITFNNSVRMKIYGDIYISVEQVKKNAYLLKIEEKIELLRVIIHGVLHLIGYNDNSRSSKLMMRKLENKYIGIYETKSLLKK
jgi:probable rRNA maturation factor